MTSVMVIAGGEPVSARRFATIAAHDLVIAADAGADHAAMYGLAVDVLVGDMDSITSETLEKLREKGVLIEDHPVDKDATDLELALDTAMRNGATQITIVGGSGGRLDHFLGNVGVICSGAYATASPIWVTESETSYVVHETRSIVTDPGTTLSVIPIGGSASGVSLSGTRWPLSEATLEPGSSLGISNIAESNLIQIALEVGRVLVVLVQGA